MKTARYSGQTTLTNYFPIPRSILQLHLCSTAVLLYGLLLDRATLSQKHDYADQSGWIYVVYPIHELCQVFRLSDTTIKDNLRLLEQKGLIRRIRRSRREASRIFLFLPEDAVMAEKPAVQSRNSGFHRAGKLPPSNIKNQQEISNLYQHQEEESL